LTGLALGRSGVTEAAFALLAIEARVAAATITGLPLVRALTLAGVGVGYHRVGTAYRALAFAGVRVADLGRIAGLRGNAGAVLAGLARFTFLGEASTFLAL
jgi:hypothetical protein